MTAKCQGNMYYITGSTNILMANVTTDEENIIKLWHNHLGHIGNQNLQQMLKDKTVEGLPNITGNLPFCEDCAINKLTHMPFPLGGNRSYQPLHIVHMDICGPMKAQSHTGNKYFISFIDDHLRKAFVYFLGSKDQVYNKFVTFKNLIKNQTGLQIKIL